MTTKDESEKSLAEIVADLSPEEQAEVLAGFDPEQLMYDADFWLRPAQKIWQGDQDWAITAVTSGRGWGKGLALDTPIPTPSGWKIMGDIESGDLVFDENGNPCAVEEAYEPYMPVRLYELTFSDGSVIVADGEHLWTTWTHRDRKSYNRRNEYGEVDLSVGVPDNWPNWTKYRANGVSTGVGPKVRNTQEIVDTFRVGKRNDLNHSIPVTRPVQYEEADLTVDPYLFGVWIGDGSSSSGEFCAHKDDMTGLMETLTERGFEFLDVRGSATNCVLVTVKGLRNGLAKMGSLGNKTIPAEYLTASEQQRRDFLAGLLDTDGHFDPAGQTIEFCSKRLDHALAVQELAQSLGQKARIIEGEATLNGKSYGTKYRVKWRPTEKLFGMPRKNEKFVPLGNQASRTMHKMIVDYKELEPYTVRCIRVASDNGLFLAGKNYTVTHNSRCASEWVRHKAMTEPGCRIAIAGRTVGDVRRVMVEGDSGILAVHPPEDRPEFKQQKAALYWPNGSIAELHSSEAPDSARGPQYHYTIGDEFAAWKTNVDTSGATLYSNLIAATRLGKNPQILLTTTPKRTQVMRDIYERARDPKQRTRIITGKTTDNSALGASYIDTLKRQYGDSDLAKQEIEGIMLDDAIGIVFTAEMIKKAKASLILPNYPLKIIAVDPSVSADPKTSDECGIVAMASTTERDLTRRRAVLLEDYSLRATPDVWAQQVVDAARETGTKNIVVEKNQGGDLLRMVIQAKDPSLNVFPVTATKGKIKRAEPIVVAMQQGRIAFAAEFPDMEMQLENYDPEDSNYSPDRMDAFVWGSTALMIDPPPGLRTPHASSFNPAQRQLNTGHLGTGRTRQTSSVKRTYT